MSSEFEVFTATTVLSNFQKQILCLEYVNSRLYVGLGDGSLLVLSDPGNQRPGSDSQWQVIQAHKAFGRKFVSQLLAIKQSALLLSLSEDGVNLHTIPQLNLTCQANRTRSATRFAWSESSSMLCVAVKRKLAIYHYDGKDFVDPKEHTLPEAPQALQWCGDAVCYATKKEYWLLQAGSGATTEIAQTNKTAQPCITETSSPEFLLLQDSASLFIGGNGRMLKRPSIAWTEAPVAVAYAKPYAVALLANAVEIRSAHRLSEHGLTQLLTISGTNMLTNSAAHVFIIASSRDGIHQLTPLAHAKQAEALASQQHFPEALAMIGLIPDEQAKHRDQLEAEMHMRYGHHLYGEGQFEDALAQLGMSSGSNAVSLLQLFPSIASPGLLQPLLHLTPGDRELHLTEPKGEAYSQAVSIVLPYLLSHRSRLAASRANETDPAQSQSTTGAAPVTSADTPAMGRSYSEAIEEDGAEPGSPVYRQPQDFLAKLQPEQRHRLSVLLDTAILKAMLAMEDTGALLRFVQRSNDVDLRDGEAALRQRGRYSELVALYQQRDQHEAALNLLHTLTLSPKDLPTPPQGASSELHDLTGVWAAVRYLVTVGGRQTRLVKRHARWILTVDPEAGLEMLTDMQPPLEPDTVLTILADQVPALCATYLEGAIQRGSVTAQEYDTKLAQIYLQTVMEQRQADSQGAEASNADGAVQEAAASSNGQASVQLPGYLQADAYTKLKRLVTNSNFIQEEQLLRAIPHAQLLEVQALLHKRQGDHKEALRIFLEQMHDLNLAEEYCDDIYNESKSQMSAGLSNLPLSLQLQLQKRTNSQDWAKPQADASHVYLMLIQALLALDDSSASSTEQLPGLEAQQQRWQQVGSLLGRKHDRINAVQALSLLPPQMLLGSLLKFVEGSMRLLVEQARNAAVVQSLRRSENLQVREDLTHCKQRSVLVTAERACIVCHRRIANTVFVAYPDDSLAHLSCHKRQTGSQSAPNRVTR